MSDLKLSKLPEPAGWWVLPGSGEAYLVKFAGFKRPRWLTIKLMWLVFEWKWEDAK